MALAKITRFVQEEIDYNKFHDFTLATIIHIKLGEVAFGTSPGEADFMLTLRAADEEDLELLTSIIAEKVEETCKEEKLKYEISFTERFPSTVNHPLAYNMVIKATRENNLDHVRIDKAFRWSEDFGHYLKHSKGAFFGLGAGIGIPALHNPDYDFPDDILASGVKMFYNIYRQIDN